MVLDRLGLKLSVYLPGTMLVNSLVVILGLLGQETFTGGEVSVWLTSLY